MAAACSNRRSVVNASMVPARVGSADRPLVQLVLLVSDCKLLLAKKTCKRMLAERRKIDVMADTPTPL